MQSFSYHRPGSLAELWPLLEPARGPVSLLAGGTDLVPALKRGNVLPTTVVDVKRLPGLAGIVPTPDGGLRVGATTTLHQVARSPEVQAGSPALAAAADTVASYQVRNRGTVGGNLCLDTRCSYFNQSAFWRSEYPGCRKMGGRSCYVVPSGDRCHALSSSDLAPLLVALGAQVEVASTLGSRLLPVEELFSEDGLRATTLGPGEILTHVVIPPAGGGHAAYRRFAVRETVDFPVLSVAVATGQDRVRLVVGHVAPRPLRAAEGERVLAAYVSGAPGTPESIGEVVAEELELTSSVRGSVSYKRQVLRTVVAEAVVEAVAGSHTAGPAALTGARADAAAEKAAGRESRDEGGV